MGLGEAPSREVRLAAPLMDARLLWIPDEDLLTHPDRLNFAGKIRLGQHPKGSKDVLTETTPRVFGHAGPPNRWEPSALA
jgi:response regulator RpfG family c-di-GMP phosphodiesterase